MPVHFEGFPRVLDRAAVRPGRWFVASIGRAAAVCMMTDVGEGAARTVLTFRPKNVEELEFAPMALAELTGTLATLEDELVISPGLGALGLKLMAPSRRPFISGSLLRLQNGDLGVGYADRLGGELQLISLLTGETALGFEFVFDNWTLSLRRGAAESLIGHFKAGLDRTRR